jgi:hypothetical protein
MKNTLILIFFLFLNSTIWSSGTTVGNAGDLLSKEFFFLAREITNNISKVELNRYDNSIDDRINTLLPILNFKVGKNLLLDGQPVTAINYPKKNTLIIDKEKWRAISKRNDKRQLILHELLWLIGIEDADYQNSEYIFKKVKEYETKLSESPISNALTAAVCEGILRGVDFPTICGHFLRQR